MLMCPNISLSRYLTMILESIDSITGHEMSMIKNRKLQPCFALQFCCAGYCCNISTEISLITRYYILIKHHRFTSSQINITIIIVLHIIYIHNKNNLGSLSFHPTLHDHITYLYIILFCVDIGMWNYLLINSFYLYWLYLVSTLQPCFRLSMKEIR